MNAIKFYGKNDAGIPEEWPVEIVPLKDGEKVPDGYIECADGSLINHRKACFDLIDSEAENAILRIVWSNLNMPLIEAIAKYLVTKDESFKALFEKVQFVIEEARTRANDLKDKLMAGTPEDIRTNWPDDIK